MKIKPMAIMLTMLAGWINCRQTEMIEYLIEENKILREKIGKKRIRLNGKQRRRPVSCRWPEKSDGTRSLTA